MDLQGFRIGGGGGLPMGGVDDDEERRRRQALLRVAGNQQQSSPQIRVSSGGGFGSQLSEAMNRARAAGYSEEEVQRAALVEQVRERVRQASSAAQEGSRVTGSGGRSLTMPGEESPGKKKKSGWTAWIQELSGAGGAAGGAALGATLGSVVPGVGTVLGGLAGGLIGGALGGGAGSAVEQKVRDDKINWGNVGKAAAWEGITGAGPVKLLRGGKAAVTAARAGAPILENVAEAAGKSTIRNVIGRGAERTYAQAFDLPSSEIITRRIKPQQTVKELMDYGVKGSVEDLQRTSQEAMSSIGRVVNRAAQEVGGDIKTGDIVNIANDALKGVDVTPGQRQAFWERVTGIGADGSLPDRIPSDTALDKIRDLQKRGHALINAGSRSISPNPDVTELGRAHLLVADEIEDNLYRAIGNRVDLNKFKTPEMIAHLNRIGKGLGDKFAQAKDVSEIRSLMAPFVRGNEMAEMTLLRQGAATGTNITNNLGARGAGAGIGFAAGGPVGAAAGFFGAPLIKAAGETLQAPLATRSGRLMSYLGPRPGGSSIPGMAAASGGRALLGNVVGSNPQAPEMTDDELLQQTNMQFAQPSLDTSGLSFGSQEDQALVQELVAAGITDPDTINQVLSSGGLESALGGFAGQSTAASTGLDYSSAELANAAFKALSAGDQASYKQLMQMANFASDYEAQIAEQQAAANPAMQFSASQQKQIMGVDAADQLVNQIEQEVSQLPSGLAGGVASLQGKLRMGGTGAAAEAYNSQRSSMALMLIKAIQGSAGNISDADRKAIEGTIPLATDNEEVRRRKLASLRQRINAYRMSAMYAPSVSSGSGSSGSFDPLNPDIFNSGY